jgi:carboxymethylenebutenolidase
MSEKISIQTPDGSFDCYVARPSGPGPHPVVIVLQEIFGVNAGLRSIADSYASKGYIAVCPDLFWRLEPGLSLSEDKERDWAKGVKLYQAYDVDRGVQDIGAVIRSARTMAGSSGKVGVTGYCLGGLMTYLSAARLDADAYAAYYGGGTDQHLDEAGKIKAPLLYHLAGDDEYISKGAQQKIKAALGGLPDAEVHTYPGRHHAFARPGGDHYHDGDARLAGSRTEAFFARTLR